VLDTQHKNTIIFIFNMYSSKLNNILLSLGAVERNRLKKFFDSPYLVANKQVCLLAKFLLDHCDNQAAMDRHYVWSKVFPEEKFDYPKLRKLASECMRSVENYFVYEDIQTDLFEIKTRIAESLAKREQKELFEQASKTLQKIDDIQTIKTSKQYFNKYQVEHAAFKLVNYDLKRFEKTNLSEITNNLDIFYVIEKLRYTCDALSRNPLTKEYDDFLLKDILQKVQTNSFLLEIPAVAIYLSIYYSMVDYENEEHYFKLKSLLEKHAGEFEQEESKKFYESAINYVVNRINSPGRDFLRELFELYQSYLEKGFIFINDQIDPYNFKNIVTTGLRLKEYEWVEYFIEEYKNRLPEVFRENVYIYHKAQLLFYTGAYGKVLQLLQEVEYDDQTYNLGAKSMLLAVYYETEEIEALQSFLDSFKVYLNRQKKKLPPVVIENYLNLIKFTRKLIKITPNNKAEIQKIKEELSKTKSVASANWLSQKIEELG